MLHYLSQSHRILVIVLLFFTVMWFIYNLLVYDSTRPEKNFTSRCILPTGFLRYIHPKYSRRAGFLYETCYNVWSIGHFVTYFTCGLIVPHQYAIIFAYSLLCEGSELIAGVNCRLSDIYVNMLAYMLGSQMNLPTFRTTTKRLIKKHELELFYGLLVTALVLLCLVYRKHVKTYFKP